MNLKVDVRKWMLFTFLMYTGFLYKFISNRLGDEVTIAIGIVFLSIMTIYLYRGPKQTTLTKPLYALLGWALASVFWAENSYDTASKCILLLLTIYSCKMLVGGHIEKFHEVFRQFIYVALIINVIALIALPQYAYRSGNISGLFYSKNDFGVFLGISTLYLFITSGLKSKINSATILFCVALLLLVKAKTVIVIVGLLMVLSSVSFLKVFRSIKYLFIQYRFASLVVLMLSFALLVASIIPSFDFLKNNINPEFLTGRGFIWSLTLEKEHAGGLFGYGFGTHWLDTLLLDGDISSPQYKWLQTIEQAHNGYLEIYASLGLVGIALLLYFIKDAFQRFKYYPFAYYFSIFMLIHNISESTWLWGMHFLFVIYLLIYLSYEEQSEL